MWTQISRVGSKRTVTTVWYDPGDGTDYHPWARILAPLVPLSVRECNDLSDTRGLGRIDNRQYVNRLAVISIYARSRIFDAVPGSWNSGQDPWHGPGIGIKGVIMIRKAPGNETHNELIGAALFGHEKGGSFGCLASQTCADDRYSHARQCLLVLPVAIPGLTVKLSIHATVACMQVRRGFSESGHLRSSILYVSHRKTDFGRQ